MRAALIPHWCAGLIRVSVNVPGKAANSGLGARDPSEKSSVGHCGRVASGLTGGRSPFLLPLSVILSFERMNE